MDRKPLTSKCNWPSHTGNRALPLPPETLMHPLPLHLMWLVALAKAERRSQIAGKVVDLLDVGQEGLVNGLLVRYPAAGHLLLLFNVSAPKLQHPGTFHPSYLCLLALLEESLLASLLLGLVGGEVLGGGNLVDLGLGDTGQVDLEGCGDDVSRVDATEGDTVDLEGAGDEEDALVEGLEEDDALAAEATGEEDQDGAGRERLAGSPRALDLADLGEIAMSVNSPVVQALPPPIVLPQPKGHSASLLRFPSPSVALLSDPAASAGDASPPPLLPAPNPAPEAPRCEMSTGGCCAITYLARLGLILGRVPLLGLLGGGGNRPSRLAKLLRCGRHLGGLGCVVRLVDFVVVVNFSATARDFEMVEQAQLCACVENEQTPS